MAQPYEQIGVVILGAGASARMGRPKLLLPWGRTSVVGHLFELWLGTGAQITIVVRPNDGPLAVELDRLQFPADHRIVNAQPERGMFSSIVCAAKWDGWRKEIARWAVVLGDQPHLRPETLWQLLACATQNKEAICQPVSGGCKGHPVILPKRAFEELKDTGAATLKDFLNLTTVPGVQCPMADAGLLLDMDTPEDYKRLLDFH